MRQDRLTTFTHDGLTFDVRDEGPLDGEPVVLLHGFPQTSASWGKVAPLLHAQGFRTFAPDQRGYSPGARPRGRRKYRLVELTGDVQALVAAICAGPVHVVGHDWGAAVAWAFAGAHQDLTKTLTAVSVPHPRAMVQALKSGTDQLRKSWYMGFFQLPFLPELLLSRKDVSSRFLRGAGMDAETFAHYRPRMVVEGRLHGGIMWYRGMLMPAPGGMGRRVRVPTTYVWSEGDVALGRLGAELTKEYVVNAPYELKVISGSHWIPDQQPELLAEAIVARARG